MSEQTGGKVKQEVAKLDEDTMDKIIEARIILHSEFPFFGQLSQYLIPRASWIVPTAAVTVDAKFLVNPDFMKTLSTRETVFVCAHETMHMVTDTINRRPAGANPMMWNMASDCAINYLILDEENGAGMQMPTSINPIYGGEWAKYHGWTTEEIYYDMLKHAKMNPEQCPMCGGDKGKKDQSDSGGQGKGDKGDEGDEKQEASGGGEGDEEGDGDTEGDGGSGGGDEDTEDDGEGEGNNRCSCNSSGQGNSAGEGMGKGYWWDNSADDFTDSNVNDEQASEWKQRCASAAAEARAAGKLPGALGQFVTDLVQPQRNWRRELRLAAHRALRRRYDWKRVSRRTAGVVRTPGKSPYMPTAVCYIDTSGSMSDEDIREAVIEVADIIKHGGGKGYLILGDAEIYFCGEVTRDALKTLPVQRGGTDFRPIFQKIEDDDLKPQIFIGFTDLEGPFPPIQPKYPVIWCRPKGWKGEAPFGKIIDIELSK